LSKTPVQTLVRRYVIARGGNVFGWLRNRKKPEGAEDVPDFFFEGEAVPDVFAGEAVHGAWDEYVKEGMRTGSSDLGWRVMKGMNEREREEFFSIYGPKGVRQEMRRRLKAREDSRRHKS
jgi:hypothetical protein